MSSAATLDAIAAAAASPGLFRRTGTLLSASAGHALCDGLNLRSRELVFVEGANGGLLAAECSRQDGPRAHLGMLDTGPVESGARVFAASQTAMAPVGDALRGRVLDGLGRPIDGAGPLGFVRWTSVYAEPPAPMTREPIAEPLPTGVRAIDAILTLGRGQRAGIFAGSGVGKSTLLGMLARGTAADVTVIALIGERGREVRDFIDHDLGREALRNCVVIASTGDNPAAMRLCAAHAATAIAEAFRDEGLDVLLLFDSLTRVAMAQREVGLAAGEPPATRGYPPSVFSLLPHLMERAGPAATGSITALYTVLVDGDDLEEPIADISRATLDGHIVLRRSLAAAHHYPPIDILGSISRLMSRVASGPHREAAGVVRRLLAAYEDARDLISIGAYVDGADPDVDRAITLVPAINALLRQPPDDVTAFDRTVEALLMLAPGVAGTDAGQPDPESDDGMRAAFLDPDLEVIDGDVIDGTAFATAGEAS